MKSTTSHHIFTGFSGNGLCESVCAMWFENFFLLIAHSRRAITWMQFNVEHTRFVPGMRAADLLQNSNACLCIKFKLESLCYNDRFENCNACKSYNECLRTKHMLWFRHRITYNNLTALQTACIFTFLYNKDNVIILLSLCTMYIYE